jgi:PAS domain S-box-containing protein
MIQPLTADSLLTFLQAMPDGMVVSDDRGRIVQVNELLERVTGYERDELIGQTIETLVPEGLGESHDRQGAEYYAAGLPSREMAGRLETLLGRKDGSQVPVDIALSRIEFLGSTLVLSAVRDATERKRTEAVIRENELRWRTFLESVRLLVVGLDSEGRITYANPFLRELCGFSEEEILGRNWFEDFIRGEAVKTVSRVFDEIMSEGAPSYFVNQIWTKGGERRVVAWHNTALRGADGHPKTTLSIGEDITDSKRYQDGLEAVNEVAQGIIEDRPLEEMLRGVTRRSRTLMDASLATVITPAPENSSLVVRVADGDHADEIEGEHFPRRGSVSDLVMRTRETLVTDDAATNPSINQPVVRLGSIGPAIFAPLAVSERAFGTLLIGRPRGAAPFGNRDRAVLELFAAQAAVALNHARARSDQQRLALLEDRYRIARDLHDGVIQSLFATGMKLQAATELAGEAADPRVVEAVDEIDHVIGDLRNYIFGLRPSIPSGGVATTLRRLGEDLQEWAHVTTVIDVDSAAAETIEPPEDLVHLVREALSNVARHAHAETCRVTVRIVDGNVTVAIDDDGQGFDPTTHFGIGQGLRNLHQRAAAIGATLEIESSLGSGTVVRATIPR